VSRALCRDCCKPVANEAEWEFIPEGEGDWLCWETNGCGNGEGLVLRQQEKIEDLRATLVRVEAERDRMRAALRAIEPALTAYALQYYDRGVAYCADNVTKAGLRKAADIVSKALDALAGGKP